jgi:hypothetical protein
MDAVEKETGQLRIADETDWVRIEIEAALGNCQRETGYREAAKEFGIPPERQNRIVVQKMSKNPLDATLARS